IGLQKRGTHPELCLDILLVERPFGIDAGMDEEVIAGSELIGQVLQENPMRLGDDLFSRPLCPECLEEIGAGNAIALQGFAAPESQPELAHPATGDAPAREALDEHLLVIAAEAEDAPVFRLALDQEI